MDKLICYIIDDEQHAIDLLKHYIEKDDRLRFGGSSNNAVNFNWTDKEEIDILFLDIQMPGMSGIEFLEMHLPTCKTILTTAFRQYAVEGYDLGVSDYLLKPILYDRFQKAIERVFNAIAISRKAQKFDQLEIQKERFVLKSGTKSISISTHEIMYIEAKGEYISINTGENRHLVYMRMKDVEKDIHFDGLIRIHRSFFVNPSYIVERTSDSVRVNDVQLPLGRSYKNQLKSILTK